MATTETSPSTPPKEVVVEEKEAMVLTSSEPHWLVTDSNVGSFALFGGQGYEYLDDLGSLYDIGNGHVRKLLTLVCSTLQDEIKTEAALESPFKFDFGFNFLDWVETEDVNEEYLSSAPISFPLVTLVQIARYLNTLSELRTSHEEFCPKLKGAGGHSQGVVAAVLLSMSKDEATLIENTVLVCRYMFYQGLRCYEVLVEEMIQQQNMVQRKNKTEKVFSYDEKAKEFKYSPMLSIRGLSPEKVEKIIKKVCKEAIELKKIQEKFIAESLTENKSDEEMEENMLCLSLVNNAESCVVSGQPKYLLALKKAIESISAAPGDKQGRVPFSDRKPNAVTQFLRIGAAFHCEISASAVDIILADAEQLGLMIAPSQLSIPVYHTSTGENLAELSGVENLMPFLVKMQSVDINLFGETLKHISISNGTTHVLDFGPSDGIARMCAIAKEGTGCLVIATSGNSRATKFSFGKTLVGLESILKEENVVNGINWDTEFSPKLLKRKCDGKLVVGTSFTKLTGKPPILMPGMTPTTSFYGIDLVAACNNGGIQGELAAGGLPIPKYFEEKIKELVSKQKPGVGVNINMLYLNAYQWSFQFPLVLEMARNGYPIESITIAAGVPTPEKASEIMNALNEVGINYVSFKPGSAAAIMDVLNIAALNPDMGVVIQWTGGRGGGHHSFEDFHIPLLETYAEIRKVPNVVLCVGSGFGDAEKSYPYLDGSWSTKAPYNRESKMPCDAVLFGSRCMVAKEAATSPEVKQLIVDACGVENEKDWEISYTGDAGGVLTVTSELGEPIHKINNRGMKCWREFDAKYFSLPPGEKRRNAIMKDKDRIIARLNSDYQKVYFGKKSDGSPADLSFLTYAEVLRRMVELMYVVDGGDGDAGRFAPNRWIDISYQTRTFKILVRTERRFLRNGNKSVADNVSKLDTKPLEFVNMFIESYPDTEKVLLAEEDVGYFINTCKDLRNGKPVNFIPVVDEHLAFWFKKDSLWCSEQIDALPGRDAQRACILQGPVAVKYSVKKDEPICSILGNIHEDYVNKLLDQTDILPIETGHLGGLTETFVGVNNGVTDIIEKNDWLEAIFKSNRIVRDGKWIKNPLPKLLKVSNPAVRFEVSSECKIDIHHDESGGHFASLVKQDNIIGLHLFDPAPGNEKLTVWFQYMPEQSYASLHQITSGEYSDENCIKEYYRKIWQCSEEVSMYDTFRDSFVLTSEDIEKYNDAIGYSSNGYDEPIGTLDIATVAGWRPLVKALFAKEIKGNLLRLVHLTHGYKLLQKETERTPLRANDEILSEARVSAVNIIPGVGKKIKVEGILSRKGVEWVELSSEFLIRGEYTDYEQTFEQFEYNAHVDCNTAVTAEVLNAQEWLVMEREDDRIEKGDYLIFQLSKVIQRYADPKHLSHVSVEGSVLRRNIDSEVDGFVDVGRGAKDAVSKIGTIRLDLVDVLIESNPVISYLEEIALPKANGAILESGGYTMMKKPILVKAPKVEESIEYAVASRDLNPIHRNSTFAEMAELPHGSTIVHGMWTAAMARGVVENSVALGNYKRISKYDVKFVGMVFPEDELVVTLKHTGVVSGRLIVEVDVRKYSTKDPNSSSGRARVQEQVLLGRVELEQLLTSFMFTGQGSASVGMGMDRYQEIECARNVWDIADKYLNNKYGFSIVDIVRNNPKELTIRFGGPQGKKLRDNYRAIKREDGSQLIPSIQSNTSSFTFKAPEGLLFATQFSQPALVLVQKAAFEELVQGGFVPEKVLFAGHSLGEYAALASYANVLSIEDLVDTVFLRGMVMQNAVPRDATGKSNYAMVAANPSRVAKSFDSAMLQDVVLAIDKMSSAEDLIQVVNFNVRNSQYVIAGTLLLLDTLAFALNEMAKTKVFSNVSSVVESALEQAKGKQSMCVKANIPYMLRRGIATIPLPGIDVPFHSRQLLGGVSAFRSLLEPRITVNSIQKYIGRLVGQYIPNVFAKPFSLEKSYIETVARVTGSENLNNMLLKFDSVNDTTKARTLLIELLAHQFAMPVQWIDTQDYIFGKRSQRVLEMGPAPTLVGMAKKTLASGFYGDMDDYLPNILWWKQDLDNIMYNLENFGMTYDEFTEELDILNTPENETENEESSISEASVETPAPAVVVAPVATPAAVVQVASADKNIDIKFVLRALLATKFQKTLEDVKDSDSIKGLSAGKSAIQNEIIGELGAEFSNASSIEDAAEITIANLATKLESSDAYKPGKVTSKMINKMMSTKLPGAFGANPAKKYLQEMKGAGPNTIDAILMCALTMQPKSRLKDASEAKQWLDDVSSKFSTDQNVTLGAPQAQASATPVGQQQQMSSVVAQIPDAPVDAKHALIVLLSAKFKLDINSIKETMSIKELANGKSAVQNEVIGEVAAEFGSGESDGAAELPLNELAQKVAGSYSKPGKVLSNAVNKMLSSKLPGAFGASAVKEYLSSQKGLGVGRVESVLLHALAEQPADRFKSTDEAKAWLDSVCISYGKWAGVDMSASVQQVASGVALAASTQVPPELMNKLNRMIHSQISSCYEFLDQDPHAQMRGLFDKENEKRVEIEQVLDGLKAELGDEFCDSIQPQHDGSKVRTYDSFWNWAIQDALDLHHHTLACVRNSKGESVPIPNSDNEYFRAMSSWITATTDTLVGEEPPQAWFRNYLCNRATPELLTVVQYFANAMNDAGFFEYAQAISLLAEQVSGWIDKPPVHISLFKSASPKTVLDDKNNHAIKYEEKPRTFISKGIEFSCNDAVMYVQEMSRGLYYSKCDISNVEYPDQSVTLETDLTLIPEDETNNPAFDHRKPRSQNQLERELRVPEGNKLTVMRKTVTRTKSFDELYDELEDPVSVDVREDYDSIHVTKQVPFVHIKSTSKVDKTVRVVDEPMTSTYLSCLHEIATNGVSFAGQVALVTGAGAGSIGLDVVKPLLEGGATVIVTARINRTDEQMQKVYSSFQRLYEEFGSRGSKLILEPFNGASKQDTASIVDHIYNVLNLDIDFIIPFAAMAERGKDISDIDSYSEAAHRLMLTNVIRLLGNVKRAKQSRGIETRPAMVLVPCSPNHGEFGMDGLYSESKLGLEALINKWSSENWENYLSISAAVIGWTRSKLMWQNNVVAEGIENLGVRTFSTTETAFNLIGLLHPQMITLAAEEPVWADLTGNWIAAPNLNEASKQIREDLYSKSKVAKAIKSTFSSTRVTSSSDAKAENNNEMAEQYVKGVAEEATLPLANPQNMSNPFPKLPATERLNELSHMKNMVDLRQTVVVVGFGEVGPWGSARTRWEMEYYGEFSLEGCIELAWLVGLIKPHYGPVKGNPRQEYFGWVDTSSNEPVADHEIKKRYEKTILKHAGIRLIEPELFEGYNPEKKMFLRQVAIDRDMNPIEVASYEEAIQYQNEVGQDFVDIYNQDPVEKEGQWYIKLKAGAVISVPRAMKFDRRVAGQIPTGWDAKRMGVPDEIANSVDPVTLYTLVSVVEALVSAGLTDPYELYEYVHVSQVGNTSGGGMGGMRSLKRIFYERKTDVEIPSDTLAESFINTMPAWVNMLLLSSSGPIKTPVGACATAAESVDIGVETILSRKARVVICGGYDDFGETGSNEFAMMGATSSSEVEKSKGRFPREASRPFTETRAGFMESQGAGMQVLMDAELAVEMGLPIYGVIALSNTATDKQGRSVPAPGRGILTTAREVNSNTGSDLDLAYFGGENPLLSVKFRSEHLINELNEVEKWKQARESIIRGSSDDEQHINYNLDIIKKMAAKKRSAAYETWGQGFYKDDQSIAPLRGALSVWGLTIDDLAVGSFHGTSTKLNDKNESALVNKQMEHLGRQKGNILYVIGQKYLTGHPKGAAAAWMMNGLLQTMNEKKIPGNRNLDNVSPELRNNGYLFYPNRSIEVPKLEAAFLKSFGFGQAGAEILVVNPDLLLAVLDDNAYSEYVVRRNRREESSYRYQQGVLSGKHGLVQVKDFAPYEDYQMEQVYLDPTARAAFDQSKNTWTFWKYNKQGDSKKLEAENMKEKMITKVESEESSSSRLKVSAKTRLQVTIQENAEGLVDKSTARSSQGVGVDVEPVATFENPQSQLVFISRNFTEKEQAYCNSASNQSASFAGRWAAKEAVVKAMSNSAPGTRSLWQGASAPLIDIEIVSSSSGAPEVMLHGHAKDVFQALGLSQIKISISHTDDVAVAQALTM